MTSQLDGGGYRSLKITKTAPALFEFLFFEAGARE
jgi:hypothetical protein